MIEYELSVNIKVENKEALDNLLITVESLNKSALEVSAFELMSINPANAVKDTLHSPETTYEQDSWLSPLSFAIAHI